MKKYFYFIITIVAALSSCAKTETDTTPFTAISVYNASPTSSTYDVYLADTKINTAALPLGGGFAYQQKVAGNYNLKFTTAGRIESLFSQTVGLFQNTYFSYFLLGRPSNFEGILFPDDLSATSTTDAYVRFINLSPDAPTLDFGVQTKTALTTKTAYKTATAYVPILAGKYTFDVKDNATQNVKATLADITLVANGHYTVITKGLITPLNSLEVPFSAQIILNK